jgi:hypothetical protein
MIKEYVEKIMRNGISNFALQKEKTTDEVQILIYWDDEAQSVGYKKVVRGEATQPIKFLEILNVKFDMMNREAICGNFIAKTLQVFSKKYNCEIRELFVMVYLDGETDDVEDVHLHLYKGRTSLQPLNLEEILG